jgi:hypothetical protein
VHLFVLLREVKTSCEAALARKEAVLLDPLIEVSTYVVLKARVPQMPLRIPL